MNRILGAFLALFLCACGSTIKVKGETKHNATVNGEVKTVNEFVFRIDVSGCQALAGENQATCITKTIEALGDLVAMIKDVACKDDVCKGVPHGEAK